jgi:hypothetical protein
MEKDRAPVTCSECGTAGVIFVAVGMDDPLLGDPEIDSLRAAWLRAGFEYDRVALRP